MRQGFYRMFNVFTVLIAIAVLSGIGIKTITSDASAVAGTTPSTMVKRGWVDDGPFAAKDGATSATHNYTTGGTSNPYYFALNTVKMRHVVLNVGVDELVTVNSTTGATSYKAGSIQRRIDNVLKWNTAHKTEKITVHLRFHVGSRAPEAWKTLCGTVTLTDPQGDERRFAVPRWWVKKGDKYPYRTLYSNAMNALSSAIRQINNKTETRNIIGSVNVPGAAVKYPEPMIIYASSDANIAAYRSANFSSSEHKAFLMWLPDVTAKYFKGVTLAELAINPTQNINTSTWKLDSKASTTYRSVASKLITKMGSQQTMISNYSAREEYMSGAGSYQSMYGWMSSTAKSKRAWVGVQLARPSKIAAHSPNTRQVWDKVAGWAVNKGFSFVETSGQKKDSDGDGHPDPGAQGDANVWTTSYKDDSNDIATMKRLQTSLLNVAHP